MSTGLATRMSPHHLSLRHLSRCLAAALVAGFALSLAPSAPAVADEDPVIRMPRVRTPAPRVRAPVRHVRHVRTVVRTRYVPVPVYTATTCGGCAVAPVVYRPAYYATTYSSCSGCAVAAPRYGYAPRYYAAGCGGCGATVAAPYYWAVRYARYRAAYGYYHGYY